MLNLALEIMINLVLFVLFHGALAILEAPETHVTGTEGKTLHLPCSAKAVEPQESPSNK